MTSIIQEKLGSGTLISWWDFRNGTVDDLSGNSTDMTFTNNPQLNRKGIGFNGVDNYLINSTANYRSTDSSGTISGWIKLKKTGSLQYFFASSDEGSTNRFLCILINNSDNIRIGQQNADTADVVVGTTTAFSTDWHHFAIVSNGSAYSIYVDGISQTLTVSSGTNSGDWFADTGDRDNITIGARQRSSIDYGEIEISNIQVFSETLTNTEIYQLMAETHPVNSTWPTKPRAKTQSTSLINLDDSPLAAWDMKIIGDTVPDITGSGNDGAVTTGYSAVKDILGYGVDFRNGPGALDCGTGLNSNDNMFIEIWFKTGSDITSSQWVWNRFQGSTTGAWGLYLNSGNLIIYDDIGNADTARYSTAIKANSIYHVVFGLGTSETNYMWINNVAADNDETSSDGLASFSGGTFIGGRNATLNPFLGSIFSVNILGTTLPSTATIQKLYNRGNKLVQYKTDWGTKVSDAAVASGFLEDTGWQVSTGTWKVSTDTINGEDVKVFECITAGILYKKLEEITTVDAAYGSWDFWVYHANDSTTDIGFSTTAGSIAGGYGLKINSSELAQINEYGVGTLGTGYTVSAATWTRFRVTRRYDGLFTLYVNGISRDTATDTTTSATGYIALDFDAGDKIAIADKKGDKAFTKYLGVI